MLAAKNVTALASRREASLRLGADADKHWKIYLAGSMQVIGPNGENALPRPRKSQALLAYLCLAPRKRASRTRLATLLWEKSDDLARRSLRQALYELERLGGVRAGGLIRLEQDYVNLNDSLCWVDVLADPHNYVEALLEDLDGLSDEFDRWLSDERKQHEDRARNNLFAEIERLEAEGATADRRAAAAQKLVGFDPTHEAAVRALMKALAEQGNHVQALREYQRCRTELRKVFGLGPSKETTALYEAIRISSPRNTVRLGPPQSIDFAPVNQNGVTPHGPSKPSIAVLPFNNISGEPHHDITAAGLAEHLIQVLSRLPGFMVSSRLSTRVFRDNERSAQDIGDLLDVRYILSGTLRVDGSRLYLTAELADAIEGVVLWANGITERFSNLIDIPMVLAEEVVRQAAPFLRAAALRKARAKRPEQLSAYDCFLQAQENMHNFSPTVFDRAERLFAGALKRDPTYATAFAWRAYWHVLRIGQGWSNDPSHDTRMAIDYAARALDCDPEEPMAYAVQGHVASYLQRDFDGAFGLFDTALRLNPNAAPVWMWRAATSAWAGDGERAVASVTRGVAISPFDPLMYFSNAVAGMAHLASGQYERAIESTHLALRDHRHYASAHRQLVMALMLAGRADEARSAAHRLLMIEPGITVARFLSRYPGRDTPLARLYADALAEAGVPRG